MLLKIISLLKFAAITLLVVSCSSIRSNKTVSDQVMSNNQWLFIADGVSSRFWYAPYATSIDPDGNVTTLLAVHNRMTGQRDHPNKIVVNCSGKLLRSFAIDQNGNWTLFKDWTSYDAGSVNELIVQRLCPIVAEDGGRRQFITAVPDTRMPNSYTTFGWELDKSYSPPDGKYTIFKYFQLLPGSTQYTYSYFFAICSNRTYASSSDLSGRKLSWNQDPPLNSAFGYLMVKACGFKLPASTTKTNSLSPSTSPGAPDPISDAKDKCASLGYKRGTEQFGNCVLKLSK